MRTICFVHKDIGDENRGGVCVSYKSLISGFLKLGWRVICITQRQYQKTEAQVINVPEEKDPYKHSKNIARIVTKIDADIVECSNYKFETLNYLKTRTRKKPLVFVRCNPSSESFLFGSEYTSGEKEMCNLADGIIAISKFANEDISKIYGRSSDIIIYEGINIDELKTFKKKEFVNSGNYLIDEKHISLGNSQLPIDNVIKKNKINIFWCGKATLMKGFDYLEKIIMDAPINLNFVLNISPSAEVLSWHKTTRNRCIFFSEPSKQDQINIWRHCDLTLITSRVEGFSLVAAESLLLRKPIVANRKCQVLREFPAGEQIYFFKFGDRSIYTAIKKEKQWTISLNSKLRKFLDSRRTVAESNRFYLSFLTR